MKPMDSPEQLGIMAKIRNSRGFSLIEMAIVLVIIGLIIAAIIKGQDLMVNSRAKQLVSTANAWKIAAFGYMDRNGKFPGVTTASTNGIIDSTAAANASAIESLAATMPQSPPNPVVIGGRNWYFYFGASTTATAGSDRNVIVVCPDIACGVALTAEDIEMVKALDTAIDGVSGSDDGMVRGFGTGTNAINTGNDSSVGGKKTGVASITTLIDKSAVGATGTAWSATHYGAAWAFDKPF